MTIHRPQSAIRNPQSAIRNLPLFIHTPIYSRCPKQTHKTLDTLPFLATLSAARPADPQHLVCRLLSVCRAASVWRPCKLNTANPHARKTGRKEGLHECVRRLRRWMPRPPIPLAYALFRALQTPGRPD